MFGTLKVALNGGHVGDLCLVQGFVVFAFAHIAALLSPRAAAAAAVAASAWWAPGVAGMRPLLTLPLLAAWGRCCEPVGFPVSALDARAAGRRPAGSRRLAPARLVLWLMPE